MKANMLIIEECLRALANCREASVKTTLTSPHMMRTTHGEVSAYTKRDLAHRLAVLLIDDAEITEGIAWNTNHPEREPHGIDTEFVARTVVMKASTYHTLYQALRYLQAKALEAKFQVKA